MHDLLREAVAKARASLKPPGSKYKGYRRLLRYEALAAATHRNSPTGSISRSEAKRLRDYMREGRFGRGQTEGRKEMEAVREGLRADRGKGKPEEKPKRKRKTEAKPESRARKRPIPKGPGDFPLIGMRRRTGRRKLAGPITR